MSLPVGEHGKARREMTPLEALIDDEAHRFNSLLRSQLKDFREGGRYNFVVQKAKALALSVSLLSVPIYWSLPSLILEILVLILILIIQHTDHGFICELLVLQYLRDNQTEAEKSNWWFGLDCYFAPSGPTNQRNQTVQARTFSGQTAADLRKYEKRSVLGMVMRITEEEKEWDVHQTRVAIHYLRHNQVPSRTTVEVVLKYLEKILQHISTLSEEFGSAGELLQALKEEVKIDADDFYAKKNAIEVKYSGILLNLHGYNITIDQPCKEFAQKLFIVVESLSDPTKLFMYQFQLNNAVASIINLKIRSNRLLPRTTTNSTKFGNGIPLGTLAQRKRIEKGLFTLMESHAALHNCDIQKVIIHRNTASSFAIAWKYMKKKNQKVFDNLIHQGLLLIRDNRDLHSTGILGNANAIGIAGERTITYLTCLALLCTGAYHISLSPFDGLIIYEGSDGKRHGKNIF